MVNWLVGNTVTNRLLFCALFILWITFGIVAYWAWWPISPAIIVLTDGARPWLTEIVPGGTLSRELTFDIAMNTTITVKRRLAQQNCVRCRLYELDGSTKYYEAGRYTQTRQVNVPLYVEPGIYRFEADASWQATPLRTGTVQLPGYLVTVR